MNQTYSDAAALTRALDKYYRVREYRDCQGVVMVIDSLVTRTLLECVGYIANQIGHWAVVEVTCKRTPNGNVRKGSRKETIVYERAAL